MFDLHSTDLLYVGMCRILKPVMDPYPIYINAMCTIETSRALTLRTSEGGAEYVMLEIGNTYILTDSRLKGQHKFHLL